MKKLIPKQSSAPAWSVSQRVLKAAHWLCDSGIQNEGRDKKLRGGVAAWYELDKKIYPFLYSEITGYALSAWMFLYRIHPDKKFLEHARLAADWLMENAIRKDGGVMTRFYLVKHYVSPNYCFHYGRIYAFDAAMAGYGFLQLFKVTEEARHRAAAEEILRFLTSRMRRKDGTYFPYFESADRKSREDFGKWSDQAGSFHAKIALLLIEYYRMGGGSFYKRCATTLLDAAVAMQQKDGRFITGRKDHSTHLHPQAYTIEGLLYGAAHLGEKKYLDAAMRGFLWMTKGVSGSGSVSSIYERNSFSHHERSDIVGQFLRIGSILSLLKPVAMKKYLPLLENVRDHLAVFQYDADKKQTGGFVYGFATDGLLRNHLNAWSTMFAFQALWMHDAFAVKKETLNLDCFV